MTTERRRAASATRVLIAGLSCSATLGLAAAMANDQPAAPSATTVPTAEPTPIVVRIVRGPDAGQVQQPAQRPAQRPNPAPPPRPVTRSDGS